MCPDISVITFVTIREAFRGVWRKNRYPRERRNYSEIVMKFEIIDNYLPANEFEDVRDYFVGQDFPWYVNQAKVMHVARMIDPELQRKEILI